ncbi:MAG: hypothetical protein MJ065_02620 [Oscillospiraceae bacterium]|nr:hypothetical protein [Oscillospiraceae bacterium]
MKLGYRERVVLIIVLLIAIFGLGIFVFIKPQWEQLTDNKKQREKLQVEWEGKLAEFDRINPTRDKIQKRVSEGSDLAQKFTAEMTSVELAEFLQKNFINTEKNTADEVILKESVSVSDPGTASLSYYYYRPNVVTYPLYENADFDGSLAKAVEEKMKEANTFALHSAQTAGSSAATFTMLINREDAMEFLDAIYNYCSGSKETMMIESVTLKECDFNENYEEDGNTPAAPVQPAANDDEEGEDGEGEAEAPAPTANEPAEIPDGIKPGYTEVTVAYRVFYMQKPTPADVGDEYHKEIWDGEEWRDPQPA